MTGCIVVDGKYYYLNPTNEGRMIAGTTANINGTDYIFDASGACQNASGVSAQTPGAASTGSVSGENGGPGVSGGSGVSSAAPGSTGSSSGSSPSGSSSGSLQPGRTDGPG